MFSIAIEMDRSSLLDLVVRLGQEFRRRNMGRHVEKLRVYYLAVREGLAASSRNAVELSWSEDLTLEWMRTLQIPPFEDAYPVKEHGVPCFRCNPEKGSSRGTPRTEAVYPGGARFSCETCGAKWLVLEHGPH